MKKQIIAALVATLTTTFTATVALADTFTWPEPGSSLTVSLAPVAAKDHRGTEFEKGWRAAVGMEIPFFVPGVSVYNETSYLTADRSGTRGSVSMTAVTVGMKASLLPFATVISPFAQAGLGLGYINQSGPLGGNDWRPVYTVGAGLASHINEYRVDLGWQFDTTHVTGGSFGANTFSITTHIPF